MDTCRNENVTKCRFVHPTYSEAKQYRNIGVWSREKLIAGLCKEIGGSCPPNPEPFKGSQQSIFKGQVKEGHGSGCKLLGAGIICSCICPRRSSRINSNKMNLILYSAAFYLYMNVISERQQWAVAWSETIIPSQELDLRSTELEMTERLRFHFSLWRTGEGNGNPLQCSCLENPRDGGAWWAAVYGVAQNRTRLKRLSSSSSSSWMKTRNPSCQPTRG